VRIAAFDDPQRIRGLCELDSGLNQATCPTLSVSSWQKLARQSIQWHLIDEAIGDGRRCTAATVLMAESQDNPADFLVSIAEAWLLHLLYLLYCGTM
jgi:hypothetical protein